VRAPGRLALAVAALAAAACPRETDHGVESLARGRLVRDLSVAAAADAACRVERSAGAAGPRCDAAREAAAEARRSGDGYEEACRRCAPRDRCAAERRRLESRWAEEDPVLGGRPGTACP